MPFLCNWGIIGYETQYLNLEGFTLIRDRSLTYEAQLNHISSTLDDKTTWLISRKLCQPSTKLPAELTSIFKLVPTGFKTCPTSVPNKVSCTPAIIYLMTVGEILIKDIMNLRYIRVIKLSRTLSQLWS